MQQYTTILHKMTSVYQNPVQYFLTVDQVPILLNDFIGKEVHLTFLGQIFCVQCGAKTAKSFQQGYCYRCYRRLQECNLCLLHPERCLVESKGCPDDWAHAHCHAKQVIYLANASDLKVGITRYHAPITRWIDQGASQAIPIMSAQNRYQIGLMEVAAKKYFKDKTNWRKMLQGQPLSLDLKQLKVELIAQLQTEFSLIQSRYPAENFQYLQEEPVEIYYPVEKYPVKVTSVSLEKTPEIHGVLRGIKGQYWIFDHAVMNMRNLGGYLVTIRVE